MKNPFDRSATMLVVNMEYDLLGPNANFVNLQQFSLLAVDTDGNSVKETLIYPKAGSSFLHDSIMETEDVAGDFLDFVDRHFVDGKVATLLAANMHDVLRYFEQSGQSVATRLKDATHIDVDTLLAVLPDKSVLVRDGFTHGGVSKLDTYELVGVYLFFRRIPALA